jgi:hypothetical protein
MINYAVVFLQNSVDLSQAGPDCYSEAYLASSCDGTQIVSMKVEEVTDVKEEEEEEEEDPMPVTFPVAKTDLLVSF